MKFSKPYLAAGKFKPGGIPFNYRFNNMRLWIGGDGKDKSPRKATVANNNGVVTGQYLDFGNVDGRNLAVNGSVISGLYKATFAAWVVPGVNTVAMAFEQGDPSFDTKVGAVLVAINGTGVGDLRLGVGGTGLYITKAVGYLSQYTKWHHLIVSYNATLSGLLKASYTVNGIECSPIGYDSSYTNDTVRVLPSDILYIGGRKTSFTIKHMDDIRIYDFAFTSTDVKNLWSVVKGTHAYK